MKDARARITDEIAGFLSHFGSFYPDGLDSHASNFSRAGVPYQPGIWLGKPITAIERKRFSRAAEAMEEEGLIKRVSAGNGTKTTHLRPTLRFVLELAAGEEDAETVQAYRNALYQSRWGRELGVAMDEMRSQDGGEGTAEI
jgi:hypothetical protein